jgi:mannose-6-phosphate isomerase-like protein (cupin superfamily)
MSDDVVRIVRLADLKPNWGSYRADEPGYQRWAVNWVGGPEGYLHMNREVGGISESCLAGLMVFPVGTSGAGLHTHGFDEVYVVHRGKMALIHGDKSETVLGPLDAAFMPAGVPHSARNVGDEDCYLIFFQAAIEKQDFQMGGEEQGSSRWLESPS